MNVVVIIYVQMMFN